MSWQIGGFFHLREENKVTCFSGKRIIFIRALNAIWIRDFSNLLNVISLVYTGLSISQSNNSNANFQYHKSVYGSDRCLQLKCLKIEGNSKRSHGRSSPHVCGFAGSIDIIWFIGSIVMFPTLRNFAKWNFQTYSNHFLFAEVVDQSLLPNKGIYIHNHFSMKSRPCASVTVCGHHVI